MGMNQDLAFDQSVYLKARVVEATQRAIRELQESAPFWDQVIFNLMQATELARQMDTLQEWEKRAGR